jgi:hypothetical protein
MDMKIWATTCPSCSRLTAGTAFYCIHDSTLLAFTPKKWVSCLLVLSPFCLSLLLSIWKTHIVIYLVLSTGILLYLGVAFRRVPQAQPLILLWGVLAFVLSGASERTFGGRDVVVNFGIITYFMLFLLMLQRRTDRYLRNNQPDIAIAISATLAILTLYSLFLELSVVLSRLGLGELWFGMFYHRWFFWIIVMRIGLVLASLVVLAVEAIHMTNKRTLKTYPVSYGLLSNSISQLRQWADYTILFVQTFVRVTEQTMGVIVRLAIRFSVEDAIPVFLIVAAAWATMWTSRTLYTYLTHGDSSALSVAIGALIVSLLTYSYAYLELVGVCSDPELRWPPLLSSLWPYWHGAAADLLKLMFYLSWLIPLTTGLLFFVRIVLERLHREALFPGIGFYFLLCSTSFLFFLSWGYFRNRREKA